MSPEYGATCGIFPVDKESLKYLRLTGRSEEQIALVEAYCKEQGLFHDANTPEAEYSELLVLDLAGVEPSLAGPKRPQDRVVLSKAGESFRTSLPSLSSRGRVEFRYRSRKWKCTKQRWEQEGGNPSAIGTEDPNVHEHVPVTVKTALRHGSVRHRRDYQLHQHFQPIRHDRRRLCWRKKAVEKGLSVPRG